MGPATGGQPPMFLPGVPLACPIPSLPLDFINAPSLDDELSISGIRYQAILAFLYSAPPNGANSFGPPPSAFTLSLAVNETVVSSVSPGLAQYVPYAPGYVPPGSSYPAYTQLLMWFAGFDPLPSPLRMDPRAALSLEGFVSVDIPVINVFTAPGVTGNPLPMGSGYSLSWQLLQSVPSGVGLLALAPAPWNTTEIDLVST